MVVSNLLFYINRGTDLIWICNSNSKMDSNNLGSQKNQNAHQILGHFRGCVIIKIQDFQLDFHFDQKNVSRLLKIFQIEGCANLDPENRMTAIISSDVLEEALKEGHVTKSSLFDPVQLPYLCLGNGNIKILQGQHRARAAFQFGVNEWLVDLFLDGMRWKFYENS